MGDVDTYLRSLVTEFPEQHQEATGDLAEWITGKLLLKRFRKAKVHEKTREDILNKVKISIAEDKPIYLVVLFGGYKHFWNQSYPEVDWAELFNLRFMSELVAPILSAYKPGVILDYESEDVIIELMDNYPTESLDSYAASFRKLVQAYSKCLPTNFKINYVRSQEQIDAKKLKARINELLTDKRKVWAAYSKEELDKHLARSPNNILWNGKEDWTKLSEAEKEQKILESKIVNETYYDADFEFRGDYLCGGNHIPIVLSWGLTFENFANWLTLGSTFSSTVDFWVGRGILEDRVEKFVPRVVSQTQYYKIKDKLEMHDSNLIPMKNFKQIEVYNGTLNF